MRSTTFVYVALSAVVATCFLLFSSFTYYDNANLVSGIIGRVRKVYDLCGSTPNLNLSILPELNVNILTELKPDQPPEEVSFIQVQSNNEPEIVKVNGDSRLDRRQLTIPGLFTIPALPTISIPGIPGIPALSQAPTSTVMPVEPTSTVGTSTPSQTSSTASASTSKASSLLSSIPGIDILTGGTSGSTTNSSNPFQQLGDLFKDGFTGIGNVILGTVDIPAFFLGIGLGKGGVTALELTTPDRAKTIASQVASANGQQPTGMNEVAMNLGDGLAAMAIPVVYKPDKPLDLTKIAPFAFPFAQGIGNGSLVGLDVSLASFKPSTKASMVDVVGNVALGLSESVTKNLDVKKILNDVKAQPLEIPSSIDLKLVAEQAGEGLSQGFVVGFGIQQKSLVFPDPRTPTNQTEAIPYAVKGFTMGLTSSFLGAVDFSRLAVKLKSLAPYLPSMSLQIPTVVEGFARGAVDGLFDGISAAGGLSNYIAGKTPADALNKTEPPGTQFNDSVSGAAVAFGRGLTNEAVLQVGIAISKKTNSVPGGALSRRDAPTEEPIINATFLNFVLQQGADAIQCTGFGGVGSIFMGLKESKTLSGNGFALDNSTMSLLPTDPVIIDTNGNLFSFKIQDMMGSITVNGMPMNRFISLTVIHVFFSVLALCFAFPIFVILNAMQHASLQFNSTQPAWIPRAQKILLYFIVPICSIVGMIMGFVGMGGSKQLRTAHGILGLLTTIFTLGVVGIHHVLTRVPKLKSSEPYLDPAPAPARSKRQNYITWSPLIFIVTLILGYSTVILGFGDLRSFSMCLVEAAITIPQAILIGSFVTFVMFAAVITLGIRLWLDRNIKPHSEVFSDGEKSSQHHVNF